jgi:hypothetical protein
MHGLNDFPMQFDTEVQYTKMVTGGGDWVGVGLEVLVYGLIGWILIRLSSDSRNQEFLRAPMRYLGLVKE